MQTGALSVSFGQALSSAMVQIGTGSPADPLQQYIPHCALLIMLAAAANVVMRVLVISAFLHAMEKSKPEIKFSNKMVCNIAMVFQSCNSCCCSLRPINSDTKMCMACFIWYKTLGETFCSNTRSFKATALHFFLCLALRHTRWTTPVLWPGILLQSKMPTNIFIVVSMGLWDVAKCRYFETSMRYSLDRDVAMGMTFENTVVRGFVTGAHEDAPQINLRNFEVLKPIGYMFRTKLAKQAKQMR